jgi:DNA-binding transcriptional regulator LsrR (DeoR family)
VVGVAGGMHKFDVIRGALRGKLVDVLITDQRIARGLLNDTADMAGAQAVNRVSL